MADYSAPTHSKAGDGDSENDSAPTHSKAGDGDREDAHVKLKNNPVHEHFDYSISTKKSTCKICKSQLAGKNPTSLG
jgi:hypothetical protein